MNSEVLQENFSKALLTASRFASQKAQLPVLGNILLSASKNKLLIASTNLEVSVAISIGAKVKKEGSLTIPSRTVTDLISNLIPGALTLEVDKEQLQITTANFSSTLSGINPSDFPEIPLNIEKRSLNLPKEEFSTALSQVSFSASIDETRPILTGVLFIFKKGSLTLVATDGFRLSQKRIVLKEASEEKKVILPKSALSELLRLLGEEESVQLSFHDEDNQVVFGVGDTILSSRTLEGNFPDFERIIPKDLGIKILVDKEDLLRAVKLASVFARDSANIVKFFLAKEYVNILAESQNSGKQETRIESKLEGSLPQGGFEIAFNYRFLEEFLHAVSGEDVSIGFSNPNAPGVFTDPSDPTFLHLIMPVKVQG